ncbi:uncharacterized protein BDR25DRAFT_377952 [Lindgomyces ingoldianus]|uniref:Uncharacterized protein n=1 Tax=Lindgomyces ingoldianus TaxID=673940 RepID=A0ACB6QJ73_9PLEO|nr:uncharacterized protein BDR25DRAFT_377952 [Lindgomyces ingoldianus]KAF2466191.1 hypothetical protein BDR25DRAFT_377952 [Lindgomyces ingoldianus]
MSPTSKLFHELSLSLLYRDVDIGLHHYKMPLETSAEVYQVHHFTQFVYHWAYWRPEDIARKHSRFIRQLIRTPEYARHVRRLTWTLDIWHYVRDMCSDDQVLHAQHSFHMFGAMENVTNVDIDGGSMNRPSTVPKPTPSEARTEKNTPCCIYGLLDSSDLQARCTNLDHLFLKKQGQEHVQQERPSELTLDEKVYEEWAAFVVAVQPRHLRLEHGRSTLSPWNRVRPKWYGSPWGQVLSIIRQKIMPMDERFRHFLGPTLSVGWTRLKTLELGGVFEEVTTLGGERGQT